MRKTKQNQCLIGALLSAIFIAATGCPTQTVAEEGVPIPGWHLLRTPLPRGGESVSINHTADTRRSDLDLAGLLLRCPAGKDLNATQSEASPQVIIVVITPFPPHARPSVSIGAHGQQWRFEASVVSPGSELLLPAGAASLAAGPWQNSPELRVDVSSQDRSFGGVIPIAGLAGALGTLAASCAAN